MKQCKCEKGHFYDGDQSASCPICADMARGNGMMRKDDDNQVTVTLKKEGDGVIDMSRPEVTQPNDPKTVGIFSRDTVKRVAGWLVCTKGLHKGEDYRLTAGRNFIGRGEGMDIKLTNENSVSRSRHAIVLYDPKQRVFLAQMGESHELVYLNNELLLGNAPLKAYDRLQLGEAELMLIPCCGDKFDWTEAKEAADETEA